MSAPREVVIEFTEATKFSKPYWTIVSVWGERIVRSIADLTTWLSQHDYRNVIGPLGATNAWRRP